MSDPRVPRGEPEIWPGSISPRAEFWTPIQVFHVELFCPTCRRGRLVASGETHEKGNLHVCNGCGAKWIVPGEYPRREERVDLTAQPMRGDAYAQAKV